MVCSIWLGFLHSGVFECFPGVYELFAGCSVLVLDGSCYTSLLFVWGLFVSYVLLWVLWHSVWWFWVLFGGDCCDAGVVVSVVIV